MKNYYGDEISNEVVKDTNMNAFDFLCNSTKDYDNLVSMSYFGNEISYLDLKKMAYIYANKLKSYGLKKGDTVSLLLPNVPEVVYYYYGAWILGVRINPIDPRFNPQGILESVNSSNSVILVSLLDSYKTKVSPIFDKLNAENIVLLSPTDSMGNSFKDVFSKAIYKYKESVVSLSEKDFKSNKVIMNKKFLKDTDSKIIPSTYEDNLIASHIFTSGTTGTPKAALLSHQAFNIKSNQIKYGVPGLDPADRFLAIIPFFSGYGSFAGMHNCLNKGMNMIMIPNFNPNMVTDLVLKYKTSAMIGVPKYWEDFALNYESMKKKYGIEDLSFLKHPVAGGDKINPSIVDLCNEVFEKNNSPAKLIVGYGSTETGGPIATTISDKDYYDNENTGVLFPGVDAVFVDPETNLIDPNSNFGELSIHDPAMMLGYADKDETNNISFEYNGKKYIKMGDLFETNDKGQLYFRGRTKRVMMRPDGHTVHSLPIENAINLDDNVEDSCVVGLKKSDNSSGTIPTAFVILKDGEVDLNEMTKKLDDISLQHLSERNRALAYVYVDKLPYTLMGKVDYKTLESLIIDDLDYYLVDNPFISKSTHLLARKK